jgi:hypothetical protein
VVGLDALRRRPPSRPPTWTGHGSAELAAPTAASCRTGPGDQYWKTENSTASTARAGRHRRPRRVQVPRASRSRPFTVTIRVSSATAAETCPPPAMRPTSTCRVSTAADQRRLYLPDRTLHRGDFPHGAVYNLRLPAQRQRAGTRYRPTWITSRTLNCFVRASCRASRAGETFPSSATRRRSSPGRRRRRNTSRL